VTQSHGYHLLWCETQSGLCSHTASKEEEEEEDDLRTEGRLKKRQIEDKLAWEGSTTTTKTQSGVEFIN